MKKYGEVDHRGLAAWAADCAQRVLPFFEKARPKDIRPRKAIGAGRAWVRTGVFRMADIRGASLAAHAAARAVKRDSAAHFAARAAGHAAATPHVPQHAFGAAYYALKAVAAAGLVHPEGKVANEREWQLGRLPENRKPEVLKRIRMQERGGKILIKIDKGGDF